MTRTALKEKFLAAGCWERYVTLCGKYKAEGISPMHSKKRAQREINAELAAQSPSIQAETARPLPAEPELEIAAGVVSADPPNLRKAIEFVFEYLDVNGLTPAQAPSRGAWSMWRWARSSHETRGEFYKTYVAKLFPTKSQLDDERERHKDDGTAQIELIERLLKTSANKS